MRKADSTQPSLTGRTRLNHAQSEMVTFTVFSADAA
ncbi:hypothetical protein THIOKS11710020 [Thiocapsa sp. KS1]|nr:hypothetical protein THIOKS11710020 [Thiocapsa sp. KS1]